MPKLTDKIFRKAKALISTIGRMGRKLGKGADERTPKIEMAREPGLSCPKCNFRIKISIPMLLASEPIVCPRCLLKLYVDQQKSKGSLTAVTKVYEALQKVEEARNMN